jgi:uncharacterized protein YdaU (DUF1376 family)
MPVGSFPALTAKDIEMSSTPWFKFYPGDYLADTRRLTRSQHGAYLLLLIDYFATGEAPPNDDIVLARLTLCDTQSEWLAIRKAIAQHFEITDVWRNPRCEKELLARRSEHTKKSEAGKKGNEIKKGLSQSESVSDTLNDRNTRSQMLEVRSQKLEVRDQKSEPEESKSKDLRGSRLNIPQIHDEWVNWAILERPELTATKVHSIYEQFYDYWKAQPGSKGIKLDWFATWRNWVRRDKSFGRVERLSVAEQNRAVVDAFNLKLDQQEEGAIYERE